MIATTIVVGLAAYAVGWNLVFEHGPFGIYATVQTWLYSIAARHRQAWLAEGVKCPKCIGFWACMLFGAVWFVLDVRWWLYPLLVFAAHGIVIVLHHIVLRLLQQVANGRERSST